MAGTVAARLHGSSSAERFESSTATREPAFVKWTIIGISLTFFGIFLLMPLAELNLQQEQRVRLVPAKLRLFERKIA